MLYTKREVPLTPDEFKNPGSEYRGAPFWAWNNKLDADELVRQIGDLKKMGYGGFLMHVRIGMATGYLSAEYMEIVRVCVEKARREGMFAYLYDEDRWPSGFAGGLVTQQEPYRARRLLLTRRPRPEPLLASFEVVLDGEGFLREYRSAGAEPEAGGIRLHAYRLVEAPSPWYNNQTYTDTLNPRAVGEFIRITHEAYKARFRGDFGGCIPAIFTDEPQFSGKTCLNRSWDEGDVYLPWTDTIVDTFKAACGEDLLSGLPELVWETPPGTVSSIRYHYHEHTAELFAQAFADQCGEWCEANGLIFAGHLVSEPTLEGQTRATGEAMRPYRSFRMPGIDMLNDARELTTAKQAQSAARQYGREGMSSELYGVTNWDFDFRGHKLQGDWQAALGVSFRVPHLSWVSMNGEAKRDYPGTFNYQAPWYDQYPYVEDHFARVAAVMTRGNPVVRVGVLHPIESYWLHWGVREHTAEIRERMERNFQDLCGWLLRGLIDFDYICESLLPELCDIPAIRGDGFPVGTMRYRVIIVPGLETIRKTTLDRLTAFRNAGGRIIFLGDAPRYLDAVPDEAGTALWERSERYGFERLSLLEALENVREIDIRNRSGAAVRYLLYQLREEPGGAAGPIRWLFIAQADRPVNPDIPSEQAIRIRIPHDWRATLYDTQSGDIRPLELSRETGTAGIFTCIDYSLYDHDSLLIRFDAAPASEAAVMPVAEAVAGDGLFGGKDRTETTKSPLRFSHPVPVSLQEPNILLLDMAEYALNGEALRSEEEVLRLDTILRTELGWPLRRDLMAQPWVEQDTSTPHTLRLRYTFESELPLEGVELALENASLTTLVLNGTPVSGTAGGNWYVDRCIERVPLSPIRPGGNILELSLPYGRKIDVEAAYLIGDFGVQSVGTCGILTRPVRNLAFGDITRQGLPFYGGVIIYHLEAESRGGEFTLTVSCYRGQFLRVVVDGVDRGVIAYAPYRLTVRDLADGLHAVDLYYYGSRINTFGQLHAVAREPGRSWGPSSWRSSGFAWTYEYQFWPQGILKSPEIE
ncbi:MAG: hypothetical protein LBD96_03815 [Treponema sp.]|jgi:hypothetical protein|nr:hypothetical protein [Treponema sp.]